MASAIDALLAWKRKLDERQPDRATRFPNTTTLDFLEQDEQPLYRAAAELEAFDAAERKGVKPAVAATSVSSKTE